MSGSKNTSPEVITENLTKNNPPHRTTVVPDRPSPRAQLPATQFQSAST